MCATPHFCRGASLSSAASRRLVKNVTQQGTQMKVTRGSWGLMASEIFQRHCSVATGLKPLTRFKQGPTWLLMHQCSVVFPGVAALPLWGCDRSLVIGQQVPSGASGVRGFTDGGFSSFGNSTSVRWASIRGFLACNYHMMLALADGVFGLTFDVFPSPRTPGFYHVPPPTGEGGELPRPKSRCP